MADQGAVTERVQLLKDYREMYEYANRLKTFVDWPFLENCTCTPENMAKAGFVHSPTENEPDVARCFFCLRELEGWEPQDDPWHEHSRRSATCGFLGMKKDFQSLTMEEFCKLEQERFKWFALKRTQETINCFQDEMSSTTSRLRKYFQDKHQCNIDVEM